MSLKEKINKQEPIIGTWNTLLNPLLSECLSSAGLDFLIFDFEHGPFNIHETPNYVNACSRYECSSIARVPSNQDWMCLQLLDMGVEGIMLPNVKNKLDAKRFINNIKYMPQGKRGFSPYTKSGSFNNNNKNYQTESNQNNSSIIIIESIDGINNLDEILEVSSIDVIYFGAYDLSQELGIAGEIYDEKLLEILKPAIQKVIKMKKMVGGFVPNTIDEIQRIQDMGINFITYGVDSNKLHQSYANVVEWFKAK